MWPFDYARRVEEIGRVYIGAVEALRKESDSPSSTDDALYEAWGSYRHPVQAWGDDVPEEVTVKVVPVVTGRQRRRPVPPSETAPIKSKGRVRP